MRKTRTAPKKLSFLTVAVLTALAMPVYAAEEPTETRDVVVTATRTEQEVKDVPSAVEVITREELDKLGSTNLLDALRLTTSINLTSSMVGNGVSIRGMESRYALILIDGQRLTSEGSFSTGNSYEWTRINLNNVERIEIVRGIASSLYGSDALAGVINIITKKPGKPELTLNYSPSFYSDDSSTGTDNISLHYDAGKQGRWAWSLSAGQSKTDPLSEPDNEKNTTYHGKRKFVNISAQYDLADDRQLDFKADYLTEDMQSRLQSAGQPPISAPVDNTSFYDNTRKSFSIGVRGKHDTGNYEVRTYFGQQDKQQDYYNHLTGTYIYGEEKSKRKTWTTEARTTMQIHEEHLLTLGGEFRTESYSGARVSTGKESIDYTAVYLQDEYIPHERWLLIPSLRLDSSSKFESNASPKLGLTYKMNENYRLKASVGSGFRAPTLDDLYIKMWMQPMSGMNRYIYGNPDLKPEKSRGYELGIEGESKNAFGKITYFDNNVKDKINTKLVGPVMSPTSYMTYYNINKAEIDGVEVELGRQLGDYFAVKLTYTYLDAINATSKQRITSTAKHQGTLQLRYDRKDTGISAVLWNSWYDDYLDGNKVDHTFNTWNLSVNKKWNDTFETYLGVDNITNKKIYDLNIWGSVVKAGVTVRM
ncbi:MAG: TonB-dependent receptor [Sporomusaceae bacterium]|nr:TonB-dependent receptor [Sporomusaceae bacterium]